MGLKLMQNSCFQLNSKRLRDWNEMSNSSALSTVIPQLFIYMLVHENNSMSANENILNCRFIRSNQLLLDNLQQH